MQLKTVLSSMADLTKSLSSMYIAFMCYLVCTIEDASCLIQGGFYINSDCNLSISIPTVYPPCGVCRGLVGI